MLKKTFLLISCVIIASYLIPQKVGIPVKGATTADWNQKSFWYYLWGKSVTHKGVDIFAKEGTPVISATHGIVVYTGSMGRGGNVILVLSSKWRVHYYAHLQSFATASFMYVKRGEALGTVGTTGNAVGKSPHLHYSILSLFPLLWRADSAKQGWLKMFYLNPIELMTT